MSLRLRLLLLPYQDFLKESNLLLTYHLTRDILMSINLVGPTAAITTNNVIAGTYTFAEDMANDNRTRVYVVSAIGGTQTGVNLHTVDAPKQVMFKRPAQFLQPSAFNTVSGRYGRVPKNVTRVIGRGSCNVAAGQVEIIQMSTDIGIPAGGVTFDRANVEASVAMYIAALWDQREELIQAIYDGRY